MPVETRTVQQAYKFALDPTPRQARALASHVGGARFTYNWGNARIMVALAVLAAEKQSLAPETAEAERATAALEAANLRYAEMAYPHPTSRFTLRDELDAKAALERAANIAAEAVARATAMTKVPSHFDLCKQWTAFKNEHAHDPEPAEGKRPTSTAWVSENFVGTYQAALRDAAKAWSDFFASRAGKRAGRRLGRPRFKKKGRCRESFQVHGSGLKITKQSLVHRHTIKLPFGSLTLPGIQGGAHTWFSAAGTDAIVKRTRKDEITVTDKRSTTVVRRVDDVRVKVIKTYSEAIEYDHITLPKIGIVRLDESARKLRRRVDKGTARIVRGTISKDSAGRWHIALTAEVQREIRTGPSARQRAGGVTGIDLGVRDTVTLASGTAVSNPAHLERHLRRLATAQKTVSRRTRRGEPSSKRRTKAVRRVGRIHNRVASLRLDHLEKLSTSLVHSHEAIGVEGWDVRETAQRGSEDVPCRVRHDRNRVLLGSGLGMLRWKLEHKAAWYGCQVKVTTAQSATGRTCSRCGQAKTTPVAPGDDMFICPSCGWTGYRRLNTARLLARFAREEGDAGSGPESLNARGGDVSPEAGRKAGRRRLPLKREAGTRPRPG